jgi:hypothetical protein
MCSGCQETFTKEDLVLDFADADNQMSLDTHVKVNEVHEVPLSILQHSHRSRVAWNPDDKRAASYAICPTSLKKLDRESIYARKQLCNVSRAFEQCPKTDGVLHYCKKLRVGHVAVGRILEYNDDGLSVDGGTSSQTTLCVVASLSLDGKTAVIFSVVNYSHSL